MGQNTRLNMSQCVETDFATNPCLCAVQVSRVEFHPELPLLATIDRRSYLTIWDYHRGEPLFECQFGENSLYNKDTLDAIARAEANPDHFGRPLHPYMQANYLTPSVYGKLKNVAFLDIDTVCWTIAVQVWCCFLSSIFSSSTINYSMYVPHQSGELK